LSVAPATELSAGVGSSLWARAPWRRPIVSSGSIAKNKDGGSVPPDSQNGHTTTPPYSQIDRADDRDDYPAADLAGVGREVSATPPGGARRASRARAK
jgi:hypothetical protein